MVPDASRRVFWSSTPLGISDVSDKHEGGSSHPMLAPASVIERGQGRDWPQNGLSGDWGHRHREVLSQYPWDDGFTFLSPSICSSYEFRRLRVNRETCPFIPLTG